MQQVTSLSNPSFLNSENLLAQKSRVKTTSCLDFCPRVYRQHRLLYLKLKRWGKQRFQPIFSVSAFWRALAAFALFSCFEGLACLYSISITQLQRPLAPFGASFTSFAMEICFKFDFIFTSFLQSLYLSILHDVISSPRKRPRCIFWLFRSHFYQSGFERCVFSSSFLFLWLSNYDRKQLVFLSIFFLFFCFYCVDWAAAVVVELSTEIK